MSELRRRAVALTVIILLTTVIAGLHAVQGSAISGSYTQPIMKGQRVSGDESAGKMSPEQFERHDRAHRQRLPRDGQQGAGQQQDRESLAEGTAVILASFFIAIAASLIFYGTYQSREIGGEAIIFVMSAFPLLAIGSYFLVSLIDYSLPIPFRP